MKELSKKYPNVKIQVIGVENRFFGGEVDVTGLVTGVDLINTLKGKKLGDKLIISSSMLRFEGDLFLDDTSVDEVSAKLSVPLVALKNDGEELLREILK